MLKARFLAYSDTDWARDLDTWRSTTGYCIFLADIIVSWLSRCQRKVTFSSTKTEYVRMIEGAKQLTWIKSLFSKLKINLPSFHLYVDNQGVIFLSLDPAQERCTKHIDIPYYYIWECLQEGLIKLFYIGTNEQKANIFTKNLIRDKFGKIQDMIYLFSTLNIHHMILSLYNI